MRASSHYSAARPRSTGWGGFLGRWWAFPLLAREHAPRQPAKDTQRREERQRGEEQRQMGSAQPERRIEAATLRIAAKADIGCEQRPRVGDHSDPPWQHREHERAPPAPRE